ncbi:SDR family oxidoreductase [Mucilaginibacter myungsuensis]|uniref:SDR family oxidoreductase n=1 Tax=Mucilaginibacter myungsuensis TaxID=649104 RepID=A0A929L663_9SPHI|nr:SDR family oxidoreductase [Mucilaginibacter myungsuensis]MBE9663916.1 SDR family oxidoreductase [Mucilaginibacter myungsuensis]MDN3598368.1 SDR family oxidoreductase [Mucilaginibacter myungsuensis]
MHVFVTGATGFVGSAIVKELLANGHTVTGLARTDEGAKALETVGANVYRGSIYDLDSIRAGVALADGVIHTAFDHDFSKYKQNCETDRGVIAAMGEVLAGTTKPLIVTSGTALLKSDPIAKEDDGLPAGSDLIPRAASEEAADALAAQGIHASIVRLSPSTHGDGDHGFVPMLIDIARQKGEAAYVGDGNNRWPGVHRFDAAALYRKALEKGAIGAKYHAVADSGVAFRDIATIIGKKLGIPVVSKTKEQAAEYFGWMAHFAGVDNPSSSEQTQQQLDWQPTHVGLLEDVENGTYFEGK